MPAPSFERYSLPLVLSGVKRALADAKAAEGRWLAGVPACLSSWYAPGPGCCAASRAASTSQGSARELLLAKLLLSATCAWNKGGGVACARGGCCSAACGS